MSKRGTAAMTHKIPAGSSSPARSAAFSVSSSASCAAAAIEPIIGHLKTDGHLGRCYFKGRAGDAANVILSAVGHSFRCILARLRELLCLILLQLWRTSAVPPRSIRLLTDDSIALPDAR
ncbi:hypothetical protein ACVWY3_004196 [Bradyrhizobium sp. USDA 4486]